MNHQPNQAMRQVGVSGDPYPEIAAWVGRSSDLPRLLFIPSNKAAVGFEMLSRASFPPENPRFRVVIKNLAQEFRGKHRSQSR